MAREKTRNKNSRQQNTHQIDHQGHEYLYGINPISEAFIAKKRKIFELFITSGRKDGKLGDIIKLAVKRNIPISTLTFDQLSDISGTDSHQSIVAKTTPYPIADFAEIIKINKSKIILILDGIVDPQNLGAISRTALCAGADGIIIPKNRSASPVPSASKASAGALEHLPVVKVTNISTAIKDLKKHGFWIAGLDATADNSVFSTDLTAPLGIVIGGEDKGLRDLVKKNCDFTISIPQQNNFNSLNASVAGAIVMYEALRQRNKE